MEVGSRSVGGHSKSRGVGDAGPVLEPCVSLQKSNRSEFAADASVAPIPYDPKESGAVNAVHPDASPVVQLEIGNRDKTPPYNAKKTPKKKTSVMTRA